METIINIENLNLFFGKQHVLKNLNVAIPKNCVTVLLGPSGCGKTTLLKCMNRLTDLYEDVKIDGKIFFDGEDILHTQTDVTDIRKKMGLLSQRPYPLPMSIFDNIAYGMRIHGSKSRKAIKPKVQYFLEKVNLWEEVRDRLHEPASRLSIGQQQRLCLARGLAVEPQIILADEPTSALDPISSKIIEEQFKLLKDQYTILVVTHILRQARRIADYVIFIYMGEIIEHGPAKEIFTSPKDERTRNYFEGSFN
jgi:phosphate transport system ATP-binding protein